MICGRTAVTEPGPAPAELRPHDWIERPDLSPGNVASIKELVSDAATAPLTQQLAGEREHFVRNLHHANGAIGIQAFLAKQPPRYS